MPRAASFFAKVYDKTGATFRRVIDASDFLSVPNIIREVGKPAGEITILLNEQWDDFGFGTTIFDGDLVKVYAVNEDNQTGLLVYQGHITGIRTRYTATENNVELRIYPLDAVLTYALAYPATSYIKTFTTSDVDTMISDVLSNANTVHGTTFFTSSLGNPGKSITYTVRYIPHSEVIKKLMAFLNATWYYRITAGGEFQLAQWNDSVATHTFTIGRDIESIETDRTIANLKNGELLSWGSPATRTFYNDATSESDYGKRQVFVTDTELPLLTIANERGNSDIDRLKDPKVTVSLTINALYAIETIQPGDTCTVRNITGNTSQIVQGIFRIVRVEYNGAICKLKLSEMNDNFGYEFYKAITQNQST